MVCDPSHYGIRTVSVVQVKDDATIWKHMLMVPHIMT